MKQSTEFLFPLFLIAFFVIGLLNAAYLHVVVSTLLCVVFLLALQSYLNARLRLGLHPAWLLLLLCAVEVDALGNYFSMYERQIWRAPYDTFAHFVTPALVAPVVVGALWNWNQRLHHRLPPGVVIFFAIALSFSLAGFYELLEYWDERYFGGQRIQNRHDTSKDLQWGLAGILLGALLTGFVLKSQQRRSPRAVSELPPQRAAVAATRHSEQ
jgi:uncharacterized membrane protein YjdF